MASTHGETFELTEEEIDALNMRHAINACKKYGIEYKHITGINELRLLLKYELLCKAKPREKVRAYFYCRFRFLVKTTTKQINCVHIYIEQRFITI